MRLAIPRDLPAFHAPVAAALSEALGPATAEPAHQIWLVERPLDVTLGKHTIRLEPVATNRVSVRTSTLAARFMSGVNPIRQISFDDQVELLLRVPCSVRVLGLTLTLSPDS